MKILIISPYLPHPRATHGTGVFMYGLLAQLAPRHQVTLLSFCDRQELQLLDDLTSLPLEVIGVSRPKGRQPGLLQTLRLVMTRLCRFTQSIALWQPYYVVKYRNRRMGKIIRQLTSQEHFDIVQVEFAQMGWYKKFISSGKAVLHDHDVVFRPAFRRYRGTKLSIRKGLLYLEWCRWARFEPRLARQYDQVLAVTVQDKQLLSRLAHSKNISYLPRGVDVPETIGDYASREQNSLLFVGTFAHQPNVDAALWLLEDIFPRVLSSYPGAKLYIVGSKPPSLLHTLAQNLPGVKILGYVDDVLGYLRNCRVFVAPLRFGGGVKLKTIHAMANGIPVVSTPVGVEGIPEIESGAALLGRSADVLSKHICLLFNDDALGMKIAQSAYGIIKRNLSWTSVTACVEEIYSRVISD